MSTLINHLRAQKQHGPFGHHAAGGFDHEGSIYHQLSARNRRRVDAVNNATVPRALLWDDRFGRIVLVEHEAGAKHGYVYFVFERIVLPQHEVASAPTVVVPSTTNVASWLCFIVMVGIAVLQVYFHLNASKSRNEHAQGLERHISSLQAKVDRALVAANAEKAEVAEAVKTASAAHVKLLELATATFQDAARSKDGSISAQERGPSTTAAPPPEAPLSVNQSQTTEETVQISSNPGEPMSAHVPVEANSQDNEATSSGGEAGQHINPTLLPTSE